MTYKSHSDHTYEFNGWKEGETPLDLFDKKDYLTTLHGVIIGLYLIDAPTLTFRALGDEGVIHELLHLALGIDIATENSLLSIRQHIEWLQEATQRLLNDANNSNN